jgi:hypothetical protein
MKKNGFVPITPAYANTVKAAPPDLATLIQPWPAT